jgi:hypothetical protein
MLFFNVYVAPKGSFVAANVAAAGAGLFNVDFTPNEVGKLRVLVNIWSWIHALIN